MFFNAGKLARFFNKKIKSWQFKILIITNAMRFVATMIFIVASTAYMGNKFQHRKWDSMKKKMLREIFSRTSNFPMKEK
jgi:hypothetical protein